MFEIQIDNDKLVSLKCFDGSKLVWGWQSVGPDEKPCKLDLQTAIAMNNIAHRILARVPLP